MPETPESADRGRIRVLLIDDKPDPFWSQKRGDVWLYDSNLRKHFKVQWIPSASAARMLLNSVEQIAATAPRQLTRAELPPEILIFDYALTQAGEFEQSSTQESNPFPKLRSVFDRLQLDWQSIGEGGEPPGTGATKGHDRLGCYIGGVLARLFSDHPCGAVPTTAKATTEGTEAGFYEWLNAQHFQELFLSKTRELPEWDDLLRVGVRSLRKRIVDLVGCGAIRIDLQRASEVSIDPIKHKGDTISIVSRYGTRDLSLCGLFADHLLIAVDAAAFQEAAREWALLVLTAAFRGSHPSVFREARALAESYFAAWLSETCFDRYELSELIADPRRLRKPESEERLDELANRYGIDAHQARSYPHTVVVTKDVFPLLCSTAKAPIARWASMMVTVLVEQHRRLATDAAIELFVALHPEDRHDGLVTATFVRETLGDVRADALIKQHGLREVEDTEPGRLGLPIQRFADLDDVLSALEPAPEKLLTFKHRGRKGDHAFKRDATSITNALKRLGHGKNDWGPLGLSLNDVLENNSGEADAHGIRPGEGNLLRSFADECGFPEGKWPTWLRDAP